MVALSLLCLKQDRNVDVVVPYFAPSAIEKMAKLINAYCKIKN